MTPDRGDPRPADRLAVGDHGQGLQRRLGEPHLLPAGDEALHHRGTFLAGVEPPSTRHLAQVVPAALLVVGSGQPGQGVGHLVPGPLQHLGKDHLGDRLVHDEQDRLQAGFQAGTRFAFGDEHPVAIVKHDLLTVFFLAGARGDRGRTGRPGHIDIPEWLRLL